MSETLGQPVLVENRGGANGNLGLDAVAKSAPDGYVFGHVNNAVIAVNPLLYRNLPFDPVRDLAPVALATVGGLFFMVPAELPARTLPEFVALARGRPGQLNFGSAGRARSRTWPSSCSRSRRACRWSRCITAAARRPCRTCWPGGCSS
jgi:tripartite-type tricarboxylate transporter receptor subunit TctC